MFHYKHINLKFNYIGKNKTKARFWAPKVFYMKNNCTLPYRYLHPWKEHLKNRARYFQYSAKKDLLPVFITDKGRAKPYQCLDH